MDRIEALKFLELPDDADNKQLRKRLEEKLEHFERLTKNAPSAFLKRLNAVHLSTAQSIQKYLSSIELPPLVLLPVEEEIVGVNEPLPENPPVTVEPAAVPPSPPVDEPEKPLAFLIRHTQEQAILPFPLYSGRNFIGRKADASIASFIEIENDGFVSRIHAVIFIDKNDLERSFIEDSAASNKGRPSKNGTFINGDAKRITTRVKLTQGDSIQIGQTLLIYRLNTNTLEDIVSEIQDSAYTSAVVIKK